MQLFQVYRAQLLARKLEQLDDAALEKRSKADRNAVASAAIEELYSTPFKNTVYALLDELHVPTDFFEDILGQYIDAGIPNELIILRLKALQNDLRGSIRESLSADKSQPGTPGEWVATMMRLVSINPVEYQRS